MNEGHSAFLVLELWIGFLKQGFTAEKAWQLVTEKCVFTTHTPVPAGHDKFYWEILKI